MKKISILGSTGSIGTQTLEVIAAHPEEFQLAAVSFGKNIELGKRIIAKFQPQLVSVQNKEDAEKLRTELPSSITIVHGEEGLIEVAAYSDSDVLVNAVMGSVGLVPTLKAIEAGKRIALANKETLVTAGHIVMEHVEKYGVQMLPVDSEHSALFQCLNGERKSEISRLIITASGGSFRDLTRKELKDVTVEDALKHPNWAMGAKITIDSATMMNKGLEVIEAHWLFNIPYSQIDVLLHKESIIHSMIEFIDGSTIAHLGNPDMKVPIQYALSYPLRLEQHEVKRLNLWEAGKLHFEKLSFERFKCLKLAYEAGRIGGTMTTVLNAANEIAVRLFLERKIAFLTIDDLIEEALNQHEVIQSPSLEEIQHVDKETRKLILSLVN